MRTSSLWNRLDIDSHLLEKVKSLSGDLKKLQGELDALLAKFDDYGDEIFKAHEALRKGQATEASNLSLLHARYKKALERRDDPIFDLRRRIENKRSEISVLLQPIHGRVENLIENETKNLEARFISEIPLGRKTLTGKVIDQRVFEDFEGHKWVNVSTNADAVERGKEILILAKIGAVRAEGFDELRAVIDKLEKDLSALDLEPKMIQVREGDLEVLNWKKPQEMANYILTKNGQFRI